MRSSKTNQAIDEKLKARSPEAMRQVVKCVDILEPEINNTRSGQVEKTISTLAEKPTNPQVSKPTNVENHEPTNPQVDKAINKRTYKPVTPQVEKYTTQLRPDTIKAIKQCALDQDVHDYDIVQEALDQFFSLKRHL
jgi:hypothetical protein